VYLYFLINNFHFALELFGAVVFLTATWLTFDAYFAQKDASTLFRAIGFGLVSLSNIIHALNFSNDLLSFVGLFLFILGLVLLVISFLAIKKLELSAVVVIPAFSDWSSKLSIITALLLASLSYFSFHRYKKEFNPTWIPLSLAFAFLTIGSVCEVFNIGNTVNAIFIGGHVFELVGFIFLARWVWQYLSLRIRESMVLILISGAFFLATIVTLAFSTILIGRITSDTEASLLTDAKVFQLTIQSLKDESLAKVRIMARDEDLVSALSKNDLPLLERVMEDLLEEEKVGFLTLADKDGNVILRAHAITKRGDSISDERVYEEAVSGNYFVTIENSAVEKLSIRAGDRVVSGGNTLGVLVAGYPLDNAMVDGIKKITGLEMFVYDKEALIAGTALGSDGRTRIIGLPITDNNLKEGTLANGVDKTLRVTMGDQSFLASYLPLYNGDEKIIGMISSAKSEQNILDIANATNRLTLATVIILLLVLAFPIYALTKRLINNI
jgi:hypothetical protein